MKVDLQKAGLWKRFAAWLLDLILLTILATGFGLVISSAMNYDDYVAKLNEKYAQYETKYGVEFNISQEEYEALLPEQQEAYQKANEELAQDVELNGIYNMVVHQTLIMLSVGILLSIFLLEFVVPVLFKNGQTLGKKIFGIGLMRTDYVKVNNMQLFVRAVLGKFTIEIMAPIYIMLLSFLGVFGLMGTLVVGALLIIEMVLLGVTKNNSQIHDLLAGTVVVDMATQKIFDSEEARTEYSKRIHADMVARKEY